MKNHQKQIRPIEHYGSFHAATVNKHTTYDNSGHLNPQRTHQQHDLYCWNEVQNDLSQKSSLPKAFLHYGEFDGLRNKRVLIKIIGD